MACVKVELEALICVAGQRAPAPCEAISMRPSWRLPNNRSTTNRSRVSLAISQNWLSNRRRASSRTRDSKLVRQLWVRRTRRTILFSESASDRSAARGGTADPGASRPGCRSDEFPDGYDIVFFPKFSCELGGSAVVLGLAASHQLIHSNTTSESSPDGPTACALTIPFAPDGNNAE